MLSVAIRADRSSSWAARAPRETKPSITSQSSPKDYYLYAAGYSIKGAYKSTLVLNNAMNRSRSIEVILYNRQGEALELPEITLNPHQVQYLDLEGQIHGAHIGGRFDEGSVALEVHSDFTGVGVGTELIVTDLQHHISFDVGFVRREDFASVRLKSVWWSPHKKAATRIFAANTTGDEITVTPTIHLDGRVVGLPPIILGSHRSAEIDALRTLAGLGINADNEIGGIDLQHNGPPGALAATGVVFNKSTGFSSSLRFVDAAARAGTVLHGAHLPIGRSRPQSGFPSGTIFTPHATVWNTTKALISIGGRIRYTTSSKSIAVNLAPITLAPDEVRQLDLEEAIRMVGSQVLTDAGIEIEHSGDPGAIVAAVVGADESGDQVVDVPMIDPEARMNPGGIYPWRIDGDNRAAAHLKNVNSASDGRRRGVIVQILYDEGEYIPPIQLAGPGETISIDIRKLRDEQIPDSNGNLIPRSVSSGQFVWYDSGETGQFVGRLVQYNPAEGTSGSFNYATGSCCGVEGQAITLTPATVTQGVGSTVQYLVTATFKNTCNNSTFTADVTDDATFTSNNPTICAFNSATNNSLLTLLNPGQAQVTAEWQGNLVVVDDRFPPCMGCPSVCKKEFFLLQQGGSVLVSPGVTAAIKSFTAVGDTFTADIPITLTPSPSATPVELVITRTSGSAGAASFAGGSDRMTITNSTTVTIRGDQISNTANNMRLEARVGSTVLASRQFTVISVGVFFTGSGEISTDNALRVAYNAAIGTTMLGPVITKGDKRGATGVEIMGVVLPSNFTGKIKFHRDVIQTCLFINTTSNGCGGPFDDTSPAQDDDPQSGGSGGRVYDLDAPGIGFNLGDPVGMIRHMRVNFQEFATVDDGSRVSSTLNWFSRVSVIRVSPTITNFHSGIPGDNQAGLGTTPLTLNLR